MKKDKILKSNLSTLLKRFSSTDVISDLSKGQSLTAPGQIRLDSIKDSSILKNARVNETLIKKYCSVIKEKGLTEPLYVTQKGDSYEVLYQRILFKSARRLKLETIPCVLININDEDLLLFLAAKLLSDKDSSIIEMSLVFNKIKSKLKYTQKEIASAMNLSRPQVTNIMRLINMPKEVLDDLADGKLSFGHVRAISTLSEEEMLSMIQKIYDEKLSVHDVENIIYKDNHPSEYDRGIDSISKEHGCKVINNRKKVTFIFDSEEEKEKFLIHLSIK